MIKLSILEIWKLRLSLSWIQLIILKIFKNYYSFFQVQVPYYFEVICTTAADLIGYRNYLAAFSI